MNRSDPSILLIYDDAGFIAGIQFAFFKKLVNEKYYPFSSSIAYQVFTCCAGVFKQSVGAELEQDCRTGPPGYIGWRTGIDSLESVPGLLKSLKIPAMAGLYDNPVPIRPLQIV